MRIILALLAIIVVEKSQAQQNYLESLGIDSTTKLIGYTSQLASNKDLQRHQFIIEDSTEIVSFLQKLRFGKPDDSFAREESFRIAVIKNYKVHDLVSIFPMSNNAKAPDGKMYHFDFSQLTTFSNRYPLRLLHKTTQFPTKASYDEYQKLQQQNPAFLFSYSPEFLYEGSFEMEFPRNDTFTSPQDVIDYLTPLVEQVVEKDKYNMYYELDKKNRTQKEQMTITILGSKLLFEELIVPNRKKKNWRVTIEAGDFFYKMD